MCSSWNVWLIVKSPIVLVHVIDQQLSNISLSLPEPEHFSVSLACVQQRGPQLAPRLRFSHDAVVDASCVSYSVYSRACWDSVGTLEESWWQQQNSTRLTHLPLLAWPDASSFCLSLHLSISSLPHRLCFLFLSPSLSNSWQNAFTLLPFIVIASFWLPDKLTTSHSCEI